MATSLLELLQAGKVPLRQLLDMARGPREDDVYYSRETCTEVLRQLAGHCELLIAKAQERTDLGAAVYDLERRFKNWQELEADKAREYASFTTSAESMQGDIERVRTTANDAERRASRALDVLRDKFPEHFNDDEEDL